MRGLALLVLVGFGALAPAPPAGAHALLQTSDPARGSAVARPPEAIVMAFTEEPELALTTVRVLDVAGRAYEAAPARAVPGQASVVRVPVKTLPQGSYTVSWRVISRVDGHLTAGAFSFGVGTSPLKALAAEEGASASPPPALFEVAARLLLLVGLSALLGAAWVGASAFSMLPSGVVRFMAVALVASALGLAALAEAQRAAAGVSLSRLATTFVGRALVWRGAGILLAGSGLVALAVTKQRMRGYAPAVVAARTSTRIASTRVSTKRMRGYAPAVVAAGAAAAMLAHVAAGHAGAGRSFRLASVAVQWMHFLAVGVWIGGLAALLIGVRGTSGSDRGRAVRRFSFVAGIALAVVAATGVIRAVQGIGSWSRLPSTSYGRLVLLKAGLLGLLAVLGAINRYRHVPRADTSLRGLGRVSTAELSVATVVL
ncbi:MAG: copper resistance protein CopC, partial [Acidimicrobiales bacterium]